MLRSIRPTDASFRTAGRQQRDSRSARPRPLANRLKRQTPFFRSSGHAILPELSLVDRSREFATCVKIPPVLPPPMSGATVSFRQGCMNPFG